MGLGAALRRAWVEHRAYVLLSFVVFVLSFLAGTLLVGQVELFVALGFEDLGDVFPEDFTLFDLFVNNSRVLWMLLVGTLTVGLLTFGILVINGLIVGYVVTPIVAQAGPLYPVVGLFPHGVLELPAFFIAGAIALRIVKRTIDRVRGVRDVVLGRDGWLRAGLLFLVAWGMVAVAALVEWYVTPWLLRRLFA